MDFRTIQFYPGPRLVSIVLNRPPLNIINIEMINELDEAWEEIEGLDAQVVVITGAGDRGFSAGVDVADHTTHRIETMLPGFHNVIRHIYESDCITIAAVHGHTLGGGAELAMMCDFIIAADDTRIGFPEINLGCFPPAAAARLPRSIGTTKAAEMLYLGKPVDAEEGLRIGLLSRVVPYAMLAETVDEYIASLLEKSSAVLQLTKQALRTGMERRFDRALDQNEKLFLKRLARTADAEEGIRAFIEKRAPVWKNK